VLYLVEKQYCRICKDYFHPYPHARLYLHNAQVQQVEQQENEDCVKTAISEFNVIKLAKLMIAAITRCHRLSTTAVSTSTFAILISCHASA
jgi:hypothetical protein